MMSMGFTTMFLLFAEAVLIGLYNLGGISFWYGIAMTTLLIISWVATMIEINIIRSELKKK